jgi:hypothetical protein
VDAHCHVTLMRRAVELSVINGKVFWLKCTAAFCAIYPQKCPENYWITSRAAHHRYGVILSSCLLSRQLSFCPCGCAQELSLRYDAVHSKEAKRWHYEVIT